MAAMCNVRMGKPFVRSSCNEEILDVLDALRNEPGTRLVLGREGCGKTTLLKDLVRSRASAGDVDNPAALFCAAIEIYAAVFVRENDLFLEKLGRVPFVAIDDIDSLESTVEGARLLSLLLAERRRAGFSTVLSSSESLANLQDYFGDETLLSDESFELRPLDFQGKVDFSRMLVEFYGEPGSPTVNEDSFSYLALRFSEADIDNMIRYVVTAGGYGSHDVITVDIFAGLK